MEIKLTQEMEDLRGQLIGAGYDPEDGKVLCDAVYRAKHGCYDVITGIFKELKDKYEYVNSENDVPTEFMPFALQYISKHLNTQARMFIVSMSVLGANVTPLRM